MSQASEKGAPGTRGGVAGGGDLGSDADSEPQVLSESLTSWRIRNRFARWDLHHVPCHTRASFKPAPSAELICPTCYVAVPDALIFLLQSLGEFDRMLRRQRWSEGWIQARHAELQRTRKNRYMEQWYRAVGIGPL